MPKKFFLIFILSLAFSFQPAFARDPYPSYGQRIKYIVAPNTAQQPYDNTITNPQTMMRTNGQRSDIISFSCYNPAASRDKYKYLTDPQIDTLEKATTACQQFNPPYTQIKPPYLKNNKTAETIVATCRYWIDRVDWADGIPHLLGVMGPDEYTALTSDNAYTNYMVAYALKLAVKYGLPREVKFCKK